MRQCPKPIGKNVLIRLPLSRQRAAVHYQHMPGHKGCLRRAQPDHRSGHFVGRADPADRVHWDKHRLAVWRPAGEWFEHRCANDTGCYRIDADALFGVFQRGGAGQPDHSVLGGNIGRDAEGVADQPGDRADIDFALVLPGLQPGRYARSENR